MQKNQSNEWHIVLLYLIACGMGRVVSRYVQINIIHAGRPTQIYGASRVRTIPPGEHLPGIATPLHPPWSGDHGATTAVSPVEGLTGVCEGQDHVLRTPDGGDPDGSKW